MDRGSIVNIVCVKWGTKYRPEYVARLQRMVARNLTLPHRFICFTDDPCGLGREVQIVPLKESRLEYYWSKLAIFDRYNEFSGLALYFDLDVVIVGNIDGLISQPEASFASIVDWNFPSSLNSSVMRFEVNGHQFILDTLLTALGRGDCRFEWQQVGGHGGAPVLHFTNGEQLIGDQDWITRMVSAKGRQYCGTFPREWIISYKKKDGIRGKQCDVLPPHAKVVVFHGLPKPHEVHYPWVLQHWR
jgi:hypothetical protein